MFSSRTVQWICHLLAAAILLLVPALWFEPTVPWRLAPDTLLRLGTFILAYALAGFVTLRISHTEGQRLFSRVLLAGAAVIGGWFAALAIWDWLVWDGELSETRHYSMATSLLLALTAFLLVFSAKSVRLWKAAVLALVLLIGLAWHGAFYVRYLPRPIPPARVVHRVNTSVYELEIVTYERYIPFHFRKGGGITPWGTDSVVATGDGMLYLIKGQTAGTALSITTIPRQVPLNADEFVKDAHEIFKSSKRQNVETSRFRVADLLITERDGTTRLYVTHHYWNHAASCFSLRLSMLEGRREAILDAKTDMPWKTVFETTPCLQLNTMNPSGPRFEGLENGGRIVPLNDSELLMSVGDHGFNGVNRPEQLAQDPAASYGKILRVNVNTGEAHIVSSGHRNPQGLFLSSAGALWSTEHGPRGGDELNLIKDGGNYGWPLDTLGTEYSRLSWPLNPNQQPHDGFTPPFFTFLPSVGVSNLVQYEGDAFPLWRNDLIVASLNGSALLRMRVEQNRVVFAEPIPVHHEVRDLMVGPDGGLVLWTDERDLIYLKPTPTRAGDLLLSACTACHGFNSWDRAAVGPGLSKIYGKAVASGRDFGYSDALRAFGGSWTRERLDQFLEDPEATVPGTLMTFPGIKDAAERKQLIDFLEKMPND